MKNILLTFIALFFIFSLRAQIPSYYNTIDLNLTENALKSALSDLIIDTHTTLIPYTSSSIDTWDVLKQSDLEMTNTQNVVLVYGYNDTDAIFKTDKTRDKMSSCHSSSCIGLWNREHVFAKSLANPSLDTSYPSSGTDVHNLRPADSQMNSSRNNRLFAEGSGNANITSQGYFFPGDEWKGDVARIIMYMYLRYPEQCLANNIGEGPNNYHADMPDIFLDWNVDDPVSEFELQRNTIIASHQGNRNPFIDNPYFATLIWGGASAVNTWEELSVESVESTQIKIYPNPVTTTLNFNNVYGVELNLTVYSIDNKIIKKGYVNNQLDVSNLENGIYILKIVQGDAVQVTKFIKY